MDLFIIFVTTFFAAFLSSMSGGGSSLINLPIFLWLGMSFPIATVTQKISGLFWALPAAYNYLKGRKINWFFLLFFAFFGLLGSYLGIIFITRIDPKKIQPLIGIFILAMVAYICFNKNLGLKEKNIYSKSRQFIAYPFAVLLGFYESIFGAGNGILFAIISFYTKGFDFVDAVGYYFVIACMWVSFSAFLLINQGFFNLHFAIPAIIGSILGGYFGSKYAKYKGNRFIKITFLAIGSILGLKLLLGF